LGLGWNSYNSIAGNQLGGARQDLHKFPTGGSLQQKK
jgi:hypothetical protein